MCKFIYIRDEEKFPVGCLAYQMGEKNVETVFGFSIFHPRDKFSRKLARNIASGRLEKHGDIFVSEHEERHPNDILCDICSYIESTDVPKRFKNALNLTMIRLMRSRGSKR